MLIAFLLTLLAGSATMIGAALGVIGRGTGPRQLAIGLGLSAGVMLYVSFMEILPEGIAILSGTSGEGRGAALGVLAFFAGIAVIMVLDRLVPGAVNPHEFEGRVSPDDVVAARASRDPQRSRLLRTGLVTAAVLALHNLPEGFATFAAALHSPELALPVVAAIALHNIPEGIAVAVPVRRATGSRAKAFWLAAVSGLAEPVGAVIGFALLMPWLDGPAMGAVLAVTAGVMVFVALDELLPAAEETGEHHAAIYSLVAGMAIMAITLLVL